MAVGGAPERGRGGGAGRAVCLFGSAGVHPHRRSAPQQPSPQHPGRGGVHPANTSGKMFSRQELEVLGKVPQERDVLIITDEI